MGPVLNLGVGPWPPRRSAAPAAVVGVLDDPRPEFERAERIATANRTLDRLAERRRRGTALRVDAVDLLTVYVALAFLLPGYLVFPPMGAVGRPADIFAIALFGIWGISRVLPRSAARFPIPLHAVVAGYMAAFFLSMVAGYARGLTAVETLGMDRAALTALGMVGVMLIIADGIDSPERLQTFIRRMCAFALFSSVVGAIQFLTGEDLALKIQLPGLEQYQVVFQRSRNGLPRASGTAYHAIEFGAVNAFLTMLALHVALHARRAAEKHFMWLCVIAFALSGFLSNSRTQMVAMLAAAVPVYLAWNARNRFHAVVAGLVGLAAVSLLAPGLISGLFDLFVNASDDSSVEARAADYSVALAAWSDNPLLGQGPGTWGPTGSESVDEAGVLLDNEWLGMLVTTGVLGVIGMALIFLVGMSLARRVYRYGFDTRQRHLGVTLFGVILGGAITTYLFDALFYTQFRAVVFGAIGMAGAAWRMNRFRPDPDPDAPVRLRRKATLEFQPYRPELGHERGRPSYHDRWDRLERTRHGEPDPLGLIPSVGPGGRRLDGQDLDPYDVAALGAPERHAPERHPDPGRRSS